MEKLSFKQYLESKEKLREAIKNTPKQQTQYIVKKYCKLVVGESKEERQYISLKPRQIITIDWLYENIKYPTPVGISFNTAEVTAAEIFQTFWNTSKLHKWLIRNTQEKPSIP